jgi:hypothetical protein
MESSPGRERPPFFEHGKGLQSTVPTWQAGGVTETKDSARRWSGYVCPDCRFVFRMAQDHDGQGVICPSCRRVLRFPAPGDVTLPLLAPLRRMSTPATTDGEGSRESKKRRKGFKKSGAESHSWEVEKPKRSSRREKLQMRLMLVAGGLLLALIVAGVAFSMNFGRKPVATQAAVAPPPVAVATEETEGHREAAYLTEASPLAKKFLEATTVEQLLPLVRNPGVAEARMREFYPTGSIEAPGLSKFDSAGQGVFIDGKAVSLQVMTGALGEKTMVFVDTPEGLKVDWEGWVGWSEISWDKFLSSKPTTSYIFRVTLTPVEYYNFGFSDDSKWKSYNLEAPDHEHFVFGYAAKGSVANESIHIDPDTKKLTVTLALKFPEGATSSSQVEIARFICNGWVEGVDSP